MYKSLLELVWHFKIAPQANGTVKLELAREILKQTSKINNFRMLLHVLAPNINFLKSIGQY